MENIPASSGREEQRAVGADKCTGFACAGPWKHVAALLYFLGGRRWHLSPKLGVAVEEAAQGRRRPSQTPVAQQGGCGVAQLSRTIPAFWEVSAIPICSKHKKPCGRLTDRDGLWEKKGTGPVWFRERSLGHCPGTPGSLTGLSWSSGKRWY